MFIPPKSDDCMKELFRNEIVRKHFISDVLGIPVESILSVRLLNTFLRKRRRAQKLGILDVLIELNDGAKVNIELQLKTYKHWHKRQLFYLAKLYTADLLVGEDYSRLKRCVAISILDFNLTEREEYHTVYRLRDKDGHEFSDVLEIHTLELRKKLTGQKPVDHWIQFFNVQTKEELDMIKTANPGILEAIREVKTMNLGKRMWLLYEAYLKDKRDAKARDDYVRDEGRQEGISIGFSQGFSQGTSQGISQGISLTKKVLYLSGQGLTASEIAQKLETPITQIEEILKN